MNTYQAVINAANAANANAAKAKKTANDKASIEAQYQEVLAKKAAAANNAEKKRIAAATKIQAVTRGRQNRARILAREKKAIENNKARKEVARQQENEATREAKAQENAAVKIQAAFRGTVKRRTNANAKKEKEEKNREKKNIDARKAQSIKNHRLNTARGWTRNEAKARKGGNNIKKTLTNRFNEIKLMKSPNTQKKQLDYLLQKFRQAGLINDPFYNKVVRARANIK